MKASALNTGGTKILGFTKLGELLDLSQSSSLEPTASYARLLLDVCRCCSQLLRLDAILARSI
eukprot:m.183777 g.183777  ORF g.183777 m.183777 type:complete len:63 (-) comp25517_c0_seq14:268-456(-)